MDKVAYSLEWFPAFLLMLVVMYGLPIRRHLFLLFITPDHDDTGLYNLARLLVLELADSNGYAFAHIFFCWLSLYSRFLWSCLYNLNILVFAFIHMGMVLYAKLLS